MQRRSLLERIEKEAEGLSPQEQLELVERLIQKLRKKSHFLKKELDWNGLYGLGKALWKGVDAQEYVNRLREERG